MLTYNVLTRAVRTERTHERRLRTQRNQSMARDKYIKDYRLLESVDGRGRLRVDYEYIGAYYRFAAGSAAALKAGRRALALCALGWTAFFSALVPPSTAMRTIYVSLPFAFSALPLGMLTALAFSARKAAEPMEHPLADQLTNAYPPRALFTAILPGTALLGEGIRLLTGPGDLLPGDGIFALGALTLTICGALAFAGRKALAAEKIP